MAMTLMVAGADIGDGAKHQAERRVGSGKLFDRHGGNRDHGDRQIERRRDDKRQHHGARNVAVRDLGFLHDIGEILEPMKAKKREQARIGNAGQRGRAERRRHQQDVAKRQAGMNAGDNDRHQAAGFDQREQAGEQHRFQNAPGRDRAEGCDHHDHDRALRQLVELPNVAGGAERDRGRGHDADYYGQEAGEGGGEPRLKRRAHISGLAGADGITRRQFGVRADSQRHRHRGDGEGPRRVFAGVTGDCADQHVNAGRPTVMPTP